MSESEKTLLENKDFITGVARYGVAPQRDNTIVKSILTAYSTIDDTVEVMAGCATCNKPFEAPFKIILAYCEDKNWFDLSTSKETIGTKQPKAKK